MQKTLTRMNFWSSEKLSKKNIYDLLKNIMCNMSNLIMIEINCIIFMITELKQNCFLELISTSKALL